MSTPRRDFLRTCGAGMASSTLLPALPVSADAVVIDPTPRFTLSPYLYMQFMEPLGVTDASVAAAWDYGRDAWREDFIATARDLAPGALRWGGLITRYYKWREGVGPVASRPAMRNFVWGGWENNRVGTHEFVDFCRRGGAAPLIAVNFRSDGHREYGARSGDAEEAADWVSYANAPDNRERRAHGHAEPYDVRLWQLGNETSYGSGGFTRDQSIAETIRFARAMRRRDPAIKLIGWGDRSAAQEPLWAADLIERAGEHLNYVAIHMMGQHPTRRDSLLNGNRYQHDPEGAWNELLEIGNGIEPRLAELEAVIRSKRASLHIAVTEGHLSLRPHNVNPILYEWLSGVYHARALNRYQRHGEQVRIATAADFAGTRWTNNAVMLPVPGGRSYRMPVATVMRLFKTVNGTHGVHVAAAPSSLDIAASRNGPRLYLHVANLEFRRSVEVTLSVSGAPGAAIRGGTVWEIAPDDPRMAVSEDAPESLQPQKKRFVGAQWRFPPRSVSALELELA
ncbi:MAG: hypothetical protein ACYC6M_00770 [Terriglobales bacterium]